MYANYIDSSVTAKWNPFETVSECYLALSPTVRQIFTQEANCRHRPDNILKPKKIRRACLSQSEIE